MTNIEALQQCAGSLQLIAERLEANDVLCAILSARCAQQRKDLQAAFAALGQAQTAARKALASPAQQGETWFAPMLSGRPAGACA